MNLPVFGIVCGVMVPSSLTAGVIITIYLCWRLQRRKTGVYCYNIGYNIIVGYNIVIILLVSFIRSSFDDQILGGT